MGKELDQLVGQVIASGALSKAARAKRAEEIVKARRSERRSARQKMKEAARVEIWEDRDGKARPTPERLRRGTFRLIDTEDAGITAARDDAPCIVDQLAAMGAITARQREAGHGFEDVARGSLGSPSGRSCVDFSPVGHDGEEDDETAIAARKRWDSLRRMIREADRKELIRVCWEKRRPESVDRLKRGLNATADWLGLEPEKK